MSQPHQILRPFILFLISKNSFIHFLSVHSCSTHSLSAYNKVQKVDFSFESTRTLRPISIPGCPNTTLQWPYKYVHRICCHIITCKNCADTLAFIFSPFPEILQSFSRVMLVQHVLTNATDVLILCQLHICLHVGSEGSQHMSVRIKHTEHYFHNTLFQTWGLIVIQMYLQGQVSPHQTRRAHMSQIHSGILLPGREKEWRGLARPVSRAPQVAPSGQIGQPQVPHPFCCSSLCHSIPPPS